MCKKGNRVANDVNKDAYFGYENVGHPNVIIGRKKTGHPNLLTTTLQLSIYSRYKKGRGRG